jgi:hypothetical protein
MATTAFAQGKSTEYRHDGFYLRGSVGPSLHHTRIVTDRSSDPALEATGVGLAGDVMVGATPIPRLVVGGALMGELAPAPSVELGGRELGGDYEASAGYLLVFVDVYVDPEVGAHFGGGLGYMGHTFDDASDPTDQEETHEGAGAAVWLGFDAWIAPQWSVGGMLRANAGIGYHDVERNGAGVTEKATSTSIALLATILYH